MNAELTSTELPLFVEASKNLVEALCEREDNGLARLIEPEQVDLLREIINQASGQNIDATLQRCTEILGTLGDIKAKSMMDDTDNLEIVINSLKGMFMNVPSEKAKDSEISGVLREKIDLLDHKLQALKRYLGM